MNQFVLLLGLIILSSCSALNWKKPDIRVVHFNIKELDSSKLLRPSENAQIKAVKEVLNGMEYDILSLNEIQYDLPNVPNKSFKTKGENISLLMNYVDPSQKHWNQSFYQANTGNKAKKKKDGNYHHQFSSSAVRNFADQRNFGIFPGQYSSGGFYKYKKLGENIITSLKWKDFNPKAPLKKFAQANGKTLPNDIELFDKNFTDVLVEIEGKEVHLIFLHTVPSYHFGNKKSPNYERNADQLRFLEWYLTGQTDIKVNLPNYKPLPQGAYFIAMGDWNTDPKASNPGSKVLNRLFKKVSLWMDKPSITHEGDGYAPTRFKATLDFIAFSNNLELVEGGTLYPKEERLFLGCGEKYKKDFKENDTRRLVSFFDKKQKQNCYLSINEEFAKLKDASDHFPLFAHLKFK